MRVVKPILFLLAVGAGAIAAAAAKDASTKYEEPNYKVLQKADNIEIRQYPQVIAAEVEVSGTGEGAANQAFRILAGYIFGKNVRNNKIAMTVPVTESISREKIAMTVPVTSENGEGKMVMRFYMPSKYTLETLPEAVDKRIRFLQLPEVRFAVIKFSGFASEGNIARHESELRQFLRARGIASEVKAVRAFYNPPWTLPFMRRNEVWLPVTVLDPA